MIVLPHNIIIEAYTYKGDKTIKNSITNVESEDGSRTIIGNVEIELYDTDKKKFIVSRKSDENGNFEFRNINLKDFTYMLIAHHPTGEFNGVIADNINEKYFEDKE